MQRSPQSSLRAYTSEAPRWVQNSSSRPTRPWLSRKATSSSPSSLTRTGGPSTSTSSASRAGIQYLRRRPPMGVPGPTRVKSSFSSFVSIRPLPNHPPPGGRGQPVPRRLLPVDDDRLAPLTHAQDRSVGDAQAIAAGFPPVFVAAKIGGGGAHGVRLRVVHAGRSLLA